MFGVKDYLYLGALAIVACGLLWWHHSAYEAGLAEVRGKNAVEALAAARVAAAREAALTRQINDAEVSHAQELASLQAQRDAIPARVVRVYLPAAAGARVPSNSGDACGPAGGPAADGILPQAPGLGPDVGPALYSDADRCDGLSAQVRALQAAWPR